MTDKKKIKILKQCFEETIWMAIRYAHGRRTYSGVTVRKAVKDFQEVFPDWKPKKDITIFPPTKEQLQGMSFKEDYLHDLFEI